MTTEKENPGLDGVDGESMDSSWYLCTLNSWAGNCWLDVLKSFP
jgi:hypothetical protein